MKTQWSASQSRQAVLSRNRLTGIIVDPIKGHRCRKFCHARQVGVPICQRRTSWQVVIDRCPCEGRRWARRVLVRVVRVEVTVVKERSFPLVFVTHRLIDWGGR